MKKLVVIDGFRQSAYGSKADTGSGGAQNTIEKNKLESCREEVWKGDYKAGDVSFETWASCAWERGAIRRVADEGSKTFNPLDGAVIANDVMRRGHCACDVVADLAGEAQAWVQEIGLTGHKRDDGTEGVHKITSPGKQYTNPAWGPVLANYFNRPPLTAAGIAVKAEDKAAQMYSGGVRVGSELVIHFHVMDPPPFPADANDWRLNGVVESDVDSDFLAPVPRFILPEVGGPGGWFGTWSPADVSEEILDSWWRVRWVSLVGTAIGAQPIQPWFAPLVTMAQRTR